MKYLLITALIGFVLIMLSSITGAFTLHVVGVSLFGLVAITAFAIVLREAVRDETRN